MANKNRKFSSRRLFEQQKTENNVINEIANITFKNVIDLTGKKSKYGLVDKKGNHIYPSEGFMRHFDDGNLLALNFVVDAFEDARKYYQKLLQNNKISNNSEILALNPVKSFKSIHEEYDSYLQEVYNIFFELYANNEELNAKITNFKSFVNKMLVFLDSSNRTIFFLSDILESRYTSNHSSGLIIDLDFAREDKNRTQTNKRLFADDNFGAYTYTLLRHGFRFSVNYPNRIVADIESNKMQEYMEKYDIDENTVFDEYYFKAYRRDLTIFFDYMFNFYNRYVSDIPEYKLRDKCITKRRKPLTVKEYNSIDNKYFINIYLNLKKINNKKQIFSYMDNHTLDETLDLINSEYKRRLTQNKTQGKNLRR